MADHHHEPSLIAGWNQSPWVNGTGPFASVEQRFFDIGRSGNHAVTVKSAKYPSFPALTGIRGIAALWVMLFHIGQGIPGYSLFPALMRYGVLSNGFRGVDLFFVLSGFIMMHVHAPDFVDLDLPVIRRFALMRCVRIYPAHLVTMGIILSGVAAVPGVVPWIRSWYGAALTPIGFMQTAVLANRWLLPDAGMWNTVTWSLSVELAAYSLLPVVALCLNRVQSPALNLVLAIGSIASTLSILIMAGNLDCGATTRLSLVRGIGEFVSGAAMCRFLASSRLLRPDLMAIGSIASMPILFTVPHLAILAPFSFVLLIAALTYQAGPVHAFFSSRPALFLGRISYSLYLVHIMPLMLIIYAFRSGTWADTAGTRTVALATYCVGVMLAATALHHWVERPSQRFGRRIDQLTRQLARA